ncbi:MAG: flagellar FlbD family protein [Elusimicrobiota bacterium]
MILVKKINCIEIVLNAELIETLESHGDTVISLTNGNKIIVKDTVEEIIEKVLAYRRSINKNINL